MHYKLSIILSIPVGTSHKSSWCRLCQRYIVIVILHADSQANVPTAAIVVPLVFVLLALILLVVLVAVAVKRLRIPESTFQVAFSVVDAPGSLAKALRVFKDCNVNILGLNTHLHHAEFDRNAGNGYKFNYVHCICTKGEKEFLKKELKAELEGGND